MKKLIIPLLALFLSVVALAKSDVFEFAKVDASAIALAEVDAFIISEFQHVPLLTAHYSLGGHYSLVTAHYSLLTHSLLTHSPLTYSLPDNYLNEYLKRSIKKRQLDYVLLSNSWKRRKTTA
jgi:hypothetical protein